MKIELSSREYKTLLLLTHLGEYIFLMRVVTTDLNNRIIVGMESDVGLPNCSRDRGQLLNLDISLGLNFLLNSSLSRFKS